MFDSATMASGYATARPAVHGQIVRQAFESLGWNSPVRRALDVGCGAGLSTKALEGLVTERLGIEPVAAMVNLCGEVAPGARFLVGAAEDLPIRDRTVDLITAAGSLNYTNLDRFFPEAVRVLRPGGALMVYDFSPGRSFPESGALDDWFSEFQRRYPPPLGDARFLDPGILAGLDSGFRMQSARALEIAIPMTQSAYVEYMLTETNVSTAVRNGTEMKEIRDWCARTTAPLWNAETKAVLIRGYFACLTFD